MLALFRSCVTEQDMVAIIRALIDRAAHGDTSATKILFSYVIGKPEAAPNPDQIDRDEWEHYQKDTINLQEVQQVLSSLPAKVGNDIARTALPMVTQARMQELAANLTQGIEQTAESRTQSDEREPECGDEDPSLSVTNGTVSNGSSKSGSYSGVGFLLGEGP